MNTSNDNTIRWNDFSRAIREGLVESSNYGYSTPVFPYSEEAPWEPIRCRQPAAVKDFTIDADDIDTKPAELLERLQPGEVRQLVCGTGVGKSTRMSVKLAQGCGVSGIVLCKDLLLPNVTHMYVSRNLSSMGAGVAVEVLKESHFINVSDGPVVYYAAATEFLSWLVRYPDIVTRLHLGFIYLDESHSHNPEYDVFRYLVALRKLEPARILYGTATGASDLVMEQTTHARDVVTKPLTDMDTTSADVVKSTSPFYYKNIVSRTMAFLADDRECDIWRNYYDGRDVPVFVFAHKTRTSEYGNLLDFLEEHNACVVLATSRLEDSHTFNIDVVLDSGYCTRAECDHVNGMMKLTRVAITRQQRIQRIGRIGRFKPGKAFVADVKHSRYDVSGDHVAGFYKYLWCTVFNIVVNNPEIADYAQLGGGHFDRKAAAILLNSRIVPYMIIPYVSQDGFFNGFARGMRRVLHNGVTHESGDSNSSKLADWPIRTTGEVEFSDKPLAFKAKIGGPKSWMLSLCYAWMAYSGSVSKEFSVTSTVLTAKRMDDAPGRRSPSIISAFASADRYAESLKFARGIANPGVVIPNFSRHTISQSPMDEYPVVTSNELADEDVARNRADSWVRFTDDQARDAYASGRKGKRASSSGSSDSAPDLPQCRQVEPVKYKMHKLYPMHDEYFKEFMEKQTPSRNDWSRYYDLVGMHVLFSELGNRGGGTSAGRVNAMAKYFLAVVKIHNSGLISYLQSNVASSPTAVQRFFRNTKHNDFMSIIDKSAVLLGTFQVEGFFVGTDKRMKHTRSSVAYTPDHDGTAQKGAFYVAVSRLSLGNAVAAFQTLSMPITNDNDEIQACAWNVLGSLLSTRHSCEVNGGVVHPDGFGVIKESEVKDLILFDAKVTGLRYFPTSRPVNDTEVLVFAHDVLTQEFQVHGPFIIAGQGDDWFINHAFSHGYSGAIVFDVRVECVVGLYLGIESIDDDNAVGRVATVHDFLNGDK